MAASHRPRGHETRFARTLRDAMQAEIDSISPGRLGKLSGIPRATIVNWLGARASRPRNPDVLYRICKALRLSFDEAQALFAAAGAELAVEHAELVAPVDDARDRAPYGIYATTPAGRVLYANTKLFEMLGYPKRYDFTRLDVSRDLYARPSLREQWLDRITGAQTLIRYLVLAKRFDGSRVLVFDTATTVRDEHGAIVAFTGIWELAGDIDSALREHPLQS